MLASVAHESEIISKCIELADYPEHFAMWAYPWGEAGTPFAKPEKRGRKLVSRGFSKNLTRHFDGSITHRAGRG